MNTTSATPRRNTILKFLIPLVLVFETSLTVNSFSFTSFIDQSSSKLHRTASHIGSARTRTFITNNIKSQHPITITQTNMSTSSSSEEKSTVPEPTSMRIREIKDELDSMHIKYSDCFDKESLCARLVDARSGVVKGDERLTSNNGGTQKESANSEPAASASASSVSSNFDKEKKLEELRSLRVKELRTICAQHNIRWAHMIEKEELVQALIKHYEKASIFSPSGALTPSKVTMITDDDILDKEINNGGAATTPLMLDVFATWCGPCKMMAPQLDEAAIELGDTVRVAKIDSDQHPEWSSKLNVRGLPSIIIFDGKTGKELQRVEGALMKDDLVKLARSHI